MKIEAPINGYDIDVMVTGYPGKTVCHGGRASVAAIWSLWRSRPGNIVIPGHDIPMVLKEGRPEYLAKREAAMKAWFGDDLDTMTTIELAVR